MIFKYLRAGVISAILCLIAAVAILAMAWVATLVKTILIQSGSSREDATLHGAASAVILLALTVAVVYCIRWAYGEIRERLNP